MIQFLLYECGNRSGNRGGGCRGGEVIVFWPRSWVYDSLGPVRPLETPGKPPLEESPQTLTYRVRPRKETILLAKTGWGQTQAQSTWTPGSPAAATLDTANISAVEEVAAIGATSAGSTSLPSAAGVSVLRALERV